MGQNSNANRKALDASVKVCYNEVTTHHSKHQKGEAKGLFCGSLGLRLQYTMIQKELQARIEKIYITHQKNRWMMQGQYQKDAPGAWEFAESERTLDVIMSREEAAKWTF